MHDPDRTRAERDTGDHAPSLDDALRYAVAIGAVLVLLLPAARGFHPMLGWLPLWLLAMPLAAMWALRGFRLPRRASWTAARTVRRRPAAAQARRRVQKPRRGLARAA